jgi:hypothetical protein
MPRVSDEKSPVSGAGDNLAPLLAEALAMLPPPHRAAVIAAIGAAPEPAWRARQRALAARDAALTAAATLMPPGTPTACARALATALGRYAAAGYTVGDRPSDPLRAALYDALTLNGGVALGWKQARKVITNSGRA